MKVGIIGTNFVSDNMIDATKTITGIEIVAVCSRKLENAKQFAKKYNIENYTDNYKNFLNLNVDSVYIAVPNALHKDIAIFFLENKIPVFCEKPLASNLDEVLEIIDVAKKNDTLLVEGLVPIYTKAFSEIKANLNKVGDVRRAIFSMNQYSSRYDAYKEGVILNAFKPELSNGSTMDIGIYPLSLAIGLFGQPQSVYASAYLLSSKADGLGSMYLTYKDKEVIIMHSKINNQVLKSEIQGEKGVLQIDHPSIPKKLTLYLNNSDPEVIFEDDDKNSMYYELKAFKQAFDNNDKEVMLHNFKQIIDVHTVLTKARELSKIKFPADK